MPKEGIVGVMEVKGATFHFFMFYCFYCVFLLFATYEFWFIFFMECRRLAHESVMELGCWDSFLL